MIYTFVNNEEVFKEHITKVWHISSLYTLLALVFCVMLLFSINYNLHQVHFVALFRWHRDTKISSTGTIMDTVTIPLLLLCLSHAMLPVPWGSCRPSYFIHG